MKEECSVGQGTFHRTHGVVRAHTLSIVPLGKERRDASDGDVAVCALRAVCGDS